MDITFRSKKLERQCNDFRLLQKEHGLTRARKIRQRLDELRASDNLEVISRLPAARAHELGGDRNGQISVDLDHPFRLIFVPNHAPAPSKEDGGLDWSKVTKIIIFEIVDPH